MEINVKMMNASRRIMMAAINSSFLGGETVTIKDEENYFQPIKLEVRAVYPCTNHMISSLDKRILEVLEETSETIKLEINTSEIKEICLQLETDEDGNYYIYFF